VRRTKYRGVHLPEVTERTYGVLGDRRSMVRLMMIEAFDKYSKSLEWAEVRRRVRKRDNYKCVDCKKPVKKGDRSVVHHEYYDYWGQGNKEEVDSCVLLCPVCHNKRHRKMDAQTPFWAKRYAESDFLSDERMHTYSQRIDDLYNEESSAP